MPIGSLPGGSHQTLDQKNNHNESSMSKHVNFSDIADEERKAMERYKVEFNKLYSQISVQSRKESKPDNCLYCGCETTQFCNSHTIPAFVLRRIAEQGKLFTSGKIIDSPIITDERGVNNSSTFQIICRECDSKIFQDYENPDNYDSPPTDRMIAQIALKNHLRNIGKRQFERSLYAILREKYGTIIGDQQEVIELDLKDDMRGFRYAKKALKRSWGDEYYLFFYKKLDYVVPIAFQGKLNLLVGLNDEQINDVYNKSEKYKIQPLHAAIFPLENSSVIMLFIEKDGNRYRPFYKAFGKLSLNDQLAAINYMIFCLSEDVYLNKCLDDDYFKNDEFKRVAGQTSMLFPEGTADSYANTVKEDFSFSSMVKIKNFLAMNVDKSELQTKI